MIIKNDIDSYVGELARLGLDTRISMISRNRYRLFVVDSDNKKLTKGYEFYSPERFHPRQVYTGADFQGKKFRALKHAFRDLLSTHYIYRLAHDTYGELQQEKKNEKRH
ncbi:hypothetical protein [Salinicola rhizosphaerae]|uniref:Uncharacterized protein n=1 Tax=Salinicola rhizosphaerae TaxID=1443141 RepID=A0ABQ3DYB2_9GAMM|nr:hypothetical protein [Salinicola rhizosphaerae]GHB12928.1 hypothetical protein GCM10009038_08710 [Salinicola rhizosphaerae]